MQILVDTCIWSRALRNKRTDQQLTELLSNLVKNNLVQMIGPIRQELLSGIKSKKVFTALKYRLEAFEDKPLITADYELAAKFCNDCRRHGIQGSNIDFLICAAAKNNEWQIFTLDKDFSHYAKFLPIILFNELQDLKKT